MEQFKHVPALYKKAFGGNNLEHRGAIQQMVAMADKARREGLLALEDQLADVEDAFTRKGVQLVVDGTDSDLVRAILNSEIDGMAARHKANAHMFSVAGGFAPTLGIIGTVLGLVHVLANLSTPGLLGHAIAGAFIATLYGVGSANLIFLPVANKLKELAGEELLYREMQLEGILSIQAGDNPRMLAEKLETYLAPQAARPAGRARGGVCVERRVRRAGRGMSAAGRKRGGGGEVENEERWLLTYSDMITLLMALFIVLWAISSVNISKFNQLKAALQSAFSAKVLQANNSILTGQTAPFDQSGSPIQPIDPTNSTTPVLQVNSISAHISQNISRQIASQAALQDEDNLVHIQTLVRKFARENGLTKLVSARIEQRGLVVRLLTDNVLFGSGQATIEPQAVPLLGEIAKLLGAPDIVNPVRVEGNTDNRPIHSALYPSNWELSSARADAVLEFLLDRGVAAKRLSATGFGDVNPIEQNTTVAGRAANRRVDIVILRRTFD